MAEALSSDSVAGRSDEEIFRSIYPAMRRFAAVTAPIEMEPEDLLQDAVAATLKRHRLIDLDNPATYLRRVMLNQASNYRRRRSSERKALRSLATSMPDARPTYPSDLSELMWLTAKQRAVLYLSEVEGYRFAEVARMLGCSEPAARMAATRARRRLRRALTGEA
jgi:RNA polymerase sigma factor (sigma-70 family)